MRCGEVGVADRSPSGRRLLVIISDASLQSAPADPRAAAITGVSVLNSDGSRLRRILPAGNGGVLWVAGRAADRLLRRAVPPPHHRR
jgi:hypothetical protein